ncbi:ABC transporter permease [Paenibacillus physcomitrellae]|uniref:ABC transporter permease n=1 Tax=Paenibacillus physcomitrellae TaxID=1619311 RepID=A0ABQ1G629_9BACL|nr:ABC transporter permease [Paenibacillus physcomitrellae]GGA37469.1 ABC transporter permease [Paenibacillus physcomitrellae]
MTSLNKTQSNRPLTEMLRLSTVRETARKVWAQLRPRRDLEQAGERSRTASSFWVMVEKECGDHFRSWRFGILMAIIVLACIGSIYAAVTAIRSGDAAANDTSGSGDTFLFLKMYTLTSSSLAVPSFSTFLSWLGPLIGITLGFDAVNSERNKGTLGRLLSQPIYRDDFIKAKFVSALFVITVVVFSLGFLVMGLGLFTIGYPPTPEEFLRIIVFLLMAVIYIGFWLNLSILFSIRFRQAATSALSSIAIWLFFTIFYSMIINMIDSATAVAQTAAPETQLNHINFILTLNRISPTELFSETLTTMLSPGVRSLGPLTMDQLVGAIASPLSLGQSLLLIWPQLTGLLAATIICFGLSYVLFIRQEVRSRV